MIFVQLSGGLGNQLFQYAAAKALAVKNKTELMLDISELKKPKKSVTYREFELSNFHCDATISKPPGITGLPRFKHYGHLLNWCGKWKFLIEKKSAYRPDFLDQGDQNFLIGFWQSYKYFESISDILFSDFSPKNPLSDLSQKILFQIQASQAVGVHIRRGDYVSLDSAKNHHGSLSMKYYEESIAIIKNECPNAFFYFFSDDPQWCKTHFNYLNDDYSVISHNGGGDAWQDLILMSWCPQLIIANSSFSWWAAWLGDRRFQGLPRKVIAPSQWFLEFSLNDLAHRIPSHWVVR
ncbi:alpha-1,2-fucosyltransferase [Polynucleobacter paneuropaeus]|nr:alpha-1,2-fucosyltransferase [Polynucleobacter paneuropaeus]MBT8544371.1 alpha-1,2-fucosyltransferase [Polynucleobacter paneuropaeus]MBT8555567.1 alpha-1,2-fucosyltransferase [Polynucleobacter paneuropaeus]MBT8560843.1 alpha-1,2-fucosyltransferase [Polynucleobacter paneuropaeus]